MSVLSLTYILFYCHKYESDQLHLSSEYYGTGEGGIGAWSNNGSSKVKAKMGTDNGYGREDRVGLWTTRRR